MNGKDFKKWCKERRLTVNEVAEMFDVGLSTIFRYFKTGGEIPKTISMYIEIENNISKKDAEIKSFIEKKDDEMKRKEEEIKKLEQVIVALAKCKF